MAWSFADGFDLYASPNDAINGYWDSGNSGFYSLQAGRFSGSRCWASSSNTNLATLTKSSPSNDAVHHIAVAFQTTTALGGASQGGALTLYDGTTAQVSICFDRTGVIQLVAGANSSGTVLATYPSAFAAPNTWYHFEFEVVIHPSAGTFKVRKNGNPVDDFSATGLNTRASANSYANKLSVMTGANSNFMTAYFDDLFWKSDASSVAWLGDIRCFTRMPASDASIQFSRPAVATFNPTGSTLGSFFNGDAGATSYYISFTPPQSGTIGTIRMTANTTYSGSQKLAIYNSAANNPTTPISPTSVLTATQVPGIVTWTFSPPVPVVAGTLYFLAYESNTQTFNVYLRGGTAVAFNYSAPSTYAAFPTNNPVTTTTNFPWWFSYDLTLSTNWPLVSEVQQDALSSYVYDSTPGDADFYGLAGISSTPASVLATTVRAYMLKSDAGTRTAAVQLKSGATTVASPTLVLTTSGWQWAWRTDFTDPNTGAAWTLAAVNAATIGPKVIA